MYFFLTALNGAAPCGMKKQLLCVNPALGKKIPK